MDWNLVPDLVALSALVAVFASLLPRNAGARMQLWLAAWILIVLHFAAKIVDSIGSNAVTSFTTCATLDLAGIAFMWAGLSSKISWRGWLIVGSLAAPQLAYILLTVIGTTSTVTYEFATALGFVIPTIAIVRLVRTTRAKVLGIAACVVLTSSMLLVLTYDPDPTDGVNAILAWVYLSAGVLHYQHYLRATAGVLATFGGFVTWAAVFPIGSMIAMWLPHLNIDGTVYNIPKYLVAIGIIVTLLEDQMERSKYLALHDELTGLPNRRFFESRLQTALDRARRSGKKIALFTIDLDDFKCVNDSFGHSVGDAYLCEVAGRFLSCMRATDTCARFGGDEFIVIADALTSRVEAERIGRKIVATLDAPIALGGESIGVGASIGFALYPDDALEAEALYAISDANMYAMKHTSRANAQRLPARKASA